MINHRTPQVRYQPSLLRGIDQIVVPRQIVLEPRVPRLLDTDERLGLDEIADKPSVLFDLVMSRLSKDDSGEDVGDSKYVND
jgi:hypothetical protein